jgi:hypothetical protein
MEYDEYNEYNDDAPLEIGGNGGMIWSHEKREVSVRETRLGNSWWLTMRCTVAAYPYSKVIVSLSKMKRPQTSRPRVVSFKDKSGSRLAQSVQQKQVFGGLWIVEKFASNQRAGRRKPSELNAAYPPRKYCDLFLVFYIGLQRRKVAIDGLHKILEGKKR